MRKYHMYEAKKGYGAYNGSYSRDDRGYRPWRSGRRQWDRIICAVCTGCGKPLSRYENLKRLAFCFSCREILFPETVIPREFDWKNSPY